MQPNISKLCQHRLPHSSAGVTPSAISEPGSFSLTCPQHIFVLRSPYTNINSNQRHFSQVSLTHGDLIFLLNRHIQTQEADFHICIICYRTPKLLCNTYAHTSWQVCTVCAPHSSTCEWPSWLMAGPHLSALQTVTKHNHIKQRVRFRATTVRTYYLLFAPVINILPDGVKHIRSAPCVAVVTGVVLEGVSGTGLYSNSDTCMYR